MRSSIIQPTQEELLEEGYRGMAEMVKPDESWGGGMSTRGVDGGHSLP